jgi:hypothetical protein
MAIVGVIAHELSHGRLLGEGRMNPAEKDMEPLTDLATVFFGLGVFGANVYYYWGSQTVGNWNVTRWGRMGYLNQKDWGYALGMYAAMRGESKPDWMKHLRPDIRSVMKETLRYIAYTGDCACPIAEGFRRRQ